MTRTVLLVEDEPGIADTIVYALRTEGMEPQWCSTAAAASAALARGGVLLVILDVGLPDRSGFELCREIRSRSAVPIIFLTARADEIDRVVGLEIGADDYVVKPFSPRELTARVRAVLRRSTTVGDTAPPPAAPGDPQQVAAGPFAVDDHRLTATYFGRALALSRYQYRILRVLVERPGWVFSRSQLMDAAWEEPDASLERTVDSHIKDLRAKLRAVRPDCEAIVTHRGEGYSLKDDWT